MLFLERLLITDTTKARVVYETIQSIMNFPLVCRLEHTRRLDV